MTPANSARGRADTGPLQLWLSNTPLTSATFTPTFGHRYTFVVTATDNVRNTSQGTATTDAIQVTKYYYLGSSRVAMHRSAPTGTEVTYLHTDHLGTVSIATNASGQEMARTLHRPHGSARWISGTMPTDWGYTGQKDTGLGLTYMHARYYASYLNRWIQPDTIVPDPANPQSLNRFSYVNNNPVKYTDPTGHFTRDAIYDYLVSLYGDKTQSILDAWEADTDWWTMISTAVAGDILFGGLGSALDGFPQGGFLFTFTGIGKDKLEGGLGPKGKPSKLSLVEIQRGYTEWSNGACRFACFQLVHWVGLIHGIPDAPQFLLRPGYTKVDKTTSQGVRTLSSIAASVVGGGISWLLTGGLSVGWQGIGLLGGSAAGVGLDQQLVDLFDMEAGDVQVYIGPVYFNFQGAPGGGWSIEKYSYGTGERLPMPGSCTFKTTFSGQPYYVCP